MAKNLIPRHFIDELLGRVDIVDVIEPYLPLKKSGANFKACCPFHEEKTPSFTVSSRKQIYHCFGCGESGNAIGFLMAHQNFSFVEAVTALAQQAGVPIPQQQTVTTDPDTPDYYALLEQISQFYQQQLRQHPNKTLAVNYLKQRGLTGATAKRYAIGYAPAGWDLLLKTFGTSEKTRHALEKTGMLISKDNGGFYDRFRQRILFPIRDHRNRVLGFGGRVLDDALPKYLNSPETPIFHKGQTVYGLYEALQVKRHWPQMLIVEGYMDVVMLAQHGVPNAVATLGTALTADHIKLLARYADQFIVCFDGDDAGKKAAERALEIILSVVTKADQFSFMFLPAGEDPDTFIQRVGTTTFKQQIQQAQSLSQMLFDTLAATIGSTGLEGKTRLIQLAAPRLQQVRDQALQYMLIDELSRRVRVPADSLQKLLQLKQTSTQSSFDPQPLETSTPMRRLIALLLQYPQLATELTDPRSILELQPAGYEILKTLLDYLAENPRLSTGQLVEHWREDRLYSKIAQLATWDLHLPEAGITEELRDTCQSVIHQAKAQRIEILMIKAKQEVLTTPEKKQLQVLIKSQKQITT